MTLDTPDTLGLLLALGDGWDQTGQTTYRHKDGYGFYLSLRDGRYTIGGEWPTDSENRQMWPSDYDGPRGSITVAATRTPEQIAAEVKRRFLPVYLPTWRTMRERADGNNRYALECAETVRKVLAADVGAYNARHGSDQATTLYFRNSHAYQVRAQAQNVRFEHFNCPADVAVEILKLLRKQGD